MFAKSVGSAAAPTAGLHFTRGVVAALGARGIEIVEIDLEVGLDTFRPISAPTLAEHRIHTERYTIPDATARAVAAGRSRGARIVAIGTTVVRAVEAAAARDGTIRSGSGTTDLFITPGFGFRVVDRLVTNFHVPASTLVVLVEAFMGAGWRATYETALARGYRFLSFGDAMVADRA
jgi:S-adenosylmethionine:tRNA ribosyltransferase-isomerase